MSAAVGDGTSFQLREDPVITNGRIRSLARFVGQPVVSTVYLNVDGAYRPVRADVAVAFEHLADGLIAHGRAAGDGGLSQALKGDLQLMREWLGHSWDRSDTRGLALFAASRQAWLEVVALPWAVDDVAAFGPRPRISRLLATLYEHRPLLVALVDGRRLRLVSIERGSPGEVEGLMDLEPRAVDTDVEVGSFQHQREEAVRAHYRRAAQHLDAALGASRAEYLILGGTDEAVAGLEDHLARPVLDRTAGRISVRVSAPLNEILEAARTVECSIRGHREAESIRRLEESSGPGQAGVAGLEATLEALDERRLATLLVEKGFSAPGSRCPACGYLGTNVWQCRRCGGRPAALDDVVEPALNEAVADAAAVEFVHAGGLDRFGRIGALLRF